MATQELGQQPAIAGLESGDLGAASWVDEIPDAHRRPLRRWMWVGAGLTASTLVVGGITRLTESGLSIVDWAPIVGSIPPLNDADWQEAFARYQQYPEYVKIRPDMTLSEFKQIYFWEYLHRMLGRLIGVAFLIPFILFWIRGYLTGPMFRRVGLLFALGGLQGLMGWYMVSSGLVDRPDVSQYRLAAHLLLAITIFGCCLWFGNDLLDRQRLQLSAASRTFMTRALVVVGALLMIQIFWGALVAGLNAGFILNTFPLMNGSLLPPQGWSHDPVLINLFENLATVQWMHRLLATVLLLSGIALLLIIRRNPSLATFQRWGALLAGMIAVQYGLGILTLLSHVRIGLGVAHQLVALAIVGVLLTFLHQIRRSTPEPIVRASSPRHS
ncbi:MAG: COX15/CtaA family protein [Thermomicrobiales bacterium]|nr:COX15/CtaA family protein [Thermomicrobiales bacterium]